MKYYKVYNFYEKKYVILCEKDFNAIKHTASRYFEIEKGV